MSSDYAFHGLYLAARLLQLVARKRNTQLSAPRVPALHSVLGGLFELEHRILPKRLPGTSLFVLLQRPPTVQR